MKKVFVILSLTAFVITFSSSCKRCVTCSYTYSPAGSTQDTTITVAQECGNKQERKTYENNVKADAALVGGVVTCDN